MKNKLKKSISAILASACMVMSLPYNTCLTTPTVCSASYLENEMNHLSSHRLVEMGSIDGLAYYIYNNPKYGEVDFQEAEDKFNFKWDSVESSSLYIGQEFSYPVKKDMINDLTFEYNADLNFDKADNFGLFFDMDDPMAEGCIIDGWGTEKPWKKGEFLGEFTSCGVTYQIYKTKRSFDEDCKGEKLSEIDQYWSVAKASITFAGDTSKVESRVNIKEHLDAWANAGLKVGGVKDVYFNVNANNSTGDAVLNWFYLDHDFKYPSEENARDSYPDPWSKELSSGRINGYYDGYDYIIDKDKYFSENTEYQFLNNDKNGFSSSWKSDSKFDLFKGKSFKKNVSTENIAGLSVDYDVSVGNVSGKNFSYGAACDINSGRDKIYIVEGSSEEYNIDNLSYECSYILDGITYKLYCTWPFDMNERSYICIPETDYVDAEFNKNFSRTVDVRSHIEAIRENTGVKFDVNGCYFYIKSDDTNADVTLNSLSVDSKITSSLMGLLFEPKEYDLFSDDDESDPVITPVLKGDVNGDYVVDALDLIIYRRYILASEENSLLPQSADIDDDGNVRINDLVQVKKYILGRSKKLGISDTFDYSEDSEHYYSSVVQRSKGSIIRDVKEDGNITCAFKSVKGAEMENGSIMNHTIKLNERSGVFSIYDVNIEADNDYVFGIHGHFKDNANEFFVIEAGRYEKLLSKAEELGSFDSDGYIYDVYRVPKGKPLANGKYMSYQYWSVLRNYSVNDYYGMHLSGNINILDHIKAYEELGECSLSGLGIEKAGIFFKCSESMFSYINVNDNRMIEN